ncbi:hypothetical protein KY290_007520 [Solanum tuberosum]|uniref:Ubiquitin-like protease family profile domain-containing protein n=1 Tax=Solanum tuberosum TaxID=4113 RepID=A0ABQ7W5X2_SOLTU|nr:hypothetical protein KY290_007520 [Solanum tuberosum]
MGKSFDSFKLILKLSEDIEAFKHYPWGHDIYELTVKYLLAHLSAKTNNLFSFPRAFMAWAFEVIPHLRHQELQMPSLITLGLVENLFDSVVDNVKRELLGATTIKRTRLDDQHRCSGFLCEKCKKHDEDSIMYLKTLSQAVNEFKNKRGVKVIPSKIVRDSYTPQAKRRKKSFIKAIQNLKKKIFRELPMAVGEKLLEHKHVNLYKRVPIAQKNKLVELMRGKALRVQYGMHFFSGEDFRTMTRMNIWWEDWYIDEILCLMRERHLKYLEYYDSTDRILDLNFYTNFKQRYDEINEKAKTVGDRRALDHILEAWIGANRILAVMNLNKTHFVTLEVLLHEGRMNVYDCSLMGMEHAKFLTFIQPVFELLPKLLKQSGIMKHMPDKFLNEPWEFEGQLEPMVTNDTKAAYGSYLLAFIEHLITRTSIQPPQTLLCDNTIGQMQWIWADGIGAWSLDNVVVINDNVLFISYVILY